MENCRNSPAFKLLAKLLEKTARKAFLIPEIPKISGCRFLNVFILAFLLLFESTRKDVIDPQ